MIVFFPRTSEQISNVIFITLISIFIIYISNDIYHQIRLSEKPYEYYIYAIFAISLGISFVFWFITLITSSVSLDRNVLVYNTMFYKKKIILSELKNMTWGGSQIRGFNKLIVRSPSTTIRISGAAYSKKTLTDIEVSIKQWAARSD